MNILLTSKVKKKSMKLKQQKNLLKYERFDEEKENGEKL
jgi:hypothetical protein